MSGRYSAHAYDCERLRCLKLRAGFRSACPHGLQELFGALQCSLVVRRRCVCLQGVHSHGFLQLSLQTRCLGTTSRAGISHSSLAARDRSPVPPVLAHFLDQRARPVSTATTTHMAPADASEHVRTLRSAINSSRAVSSLRTLASSCCTDSTTPLTAASAPCALRISCRDASI